MNEYNNIIPGLHRIEHIGIAVKNADASIFLFNNLLNQQPYKTEEVISEHVKTIFYKLGSTKIELLEPTAPESPIAKFIEKKGEGIHHIAFAVNDITKEMERLKNLGFTFINEQPKIGADNKIIAFLHPKSTNGVLVELCMERKEI
ncbi:MAG: methylmalonyl-CoA epimerase [Bacteroidia bacterium]